MYGVPDNEVFIQLQRCADSNFGSYLAILIMSLKGLARSSV